MSFNNILIADDHELILTSICNILTEEFSIDRDCISMFTTSEQVLDNLRKKDYDLYILDLEFNKISGFDLIRAIREKNKKAKIIVCTMHQEIWNVNRLLEMDINGLVLKKSANLHLKRAIEHVSKDQYFLCPKFKEIKEKSQAYQRKAKISSLTEREKEVLQYIADGYKSSEIGKALGISENAVEGHRKNLFLKLDVSNAVQLVRKAIYYQLIDI